MRSNKSVKRLVIAALCLALCILLPFLTGQIPQIGSALSPMHIPVLLCGFLCGWPYGLAVGFVAPLLRTAMFGMPPIYPTAVAMAFELAAYGFFSGWLYKRLPKKIPYIYVTLVLSMLLGRVVWGLVTWLLLAVSGGAFTFEACLAGAFVNAVPGIVCHIILIPLLVIALRKAKVLENE